MATLIKVPFEWACKHSSFDQCVVRLTYIATHTHNLSTIDRNSKGSVVVCIVLGNDNDNDNDNEYDNVLFSFVTTLLLSHLISSQLISSHPIKLNNPFCHFCSNPSDHSRKPFFKIQLVDPLGKVKSKRLSASSYPQTTIYYFQKEIIYLEKNHRYEMIKGK